MDFRPLSVRRGIREPLGLHPGIPLHIKAPLRDWVDPFFYDRYNDGHNVPNIDGAIRLLQWPIKAAEPYQRRREIDARIEADDDAFLDLLDLLCKGASDDQLTELSMLLDQGKSEWMVGPGSPPDLVQRLTDETKTALEAALSPDDSASAHLAEAWSKAFGRESEPGPAWQAAVKAIEFLLQPIVEPRNPRARLGPMTAALRAKPEKWQFVLATSDDDYTATPFLRALELVGYEPGRHGTDPKRASPEQARAVVLQALVLVEWLRSGSLSVKE